MTKEPIVTDLFRFITVRNPQLLGKKQKERGFTYFPMAEARSSHFLNEFQDLEDDKEVRKAYLEDKAASFSNYFTKLSSITALNTLLYSFSLWLMKNKNVLEKEVVAENSEGIEILGDEQLMILWDNLLYQIITEKSSAIRDAILQMLVADNFLRKNDIDGDKELIKDDKDLRRLANAYVVIPNNVPNNAPTLTAIAPKPRQKDFEGLKNQLDAFEAKINLEDYTRGLKELEWAMKNLENENQNNFDAVYGEYMEQVKEAYNNATKIIDPETGEVTYEGLELPEFNFTPKNLFDEGYLEEKLSPQSLNIIEKAKEEGVGTGLDLRNYIETKESENHRIILQNKLNYTKTVLYRQSIIQVEEPDAPITSFIADAQYNRSDASKCYLNLLIRYPDTDAEIVSNELVIHFNEETITEGFDLKIVERTDKTILLSTYPETLDIGAAAKNIEVSGSVVLDNEDTLTMDAINIEIGGKRAMGLLQSNKLTTQLLPTLKHFGINKVGVVDFRKVEQEVCCYVPGEVSRIENILAKEYRERSNRQLLSTETITEFTTESEVEKLSDTTTAERNELSTEIASIINQDRQKAYGASAGIEGSMGGVSFYANGYLNGSSSTSTSNSNSTAETYAQEVTARALERVVQKVSERRTSRILREYEENNKHGFDNRKGENHVTGIYRWVDKIYTNRLINYGKRLVYEFNIPEPARFFKNAIIQQIESKQQAGNPEGLIMPDLPIHPKEFGITSAADITTGNYQEYAAKYGAVVQTPAKETLRISKSYSGGEGREKGNGATKYNFNDLEIPEGYEVTGLKWTFDYKRATNVNLHARLTIFNQTFLIEREGLYPGLGAKHTTESIPLKYPYTDTTTGVSILGWDVGGFILNITLICERTKEAYQQWQNETFEALMEGYQNQVLAYERKVREFNDFLYSTYIPPTLGNEETTMEFNPLLNRILEKRELKRLAIDMMTRPYNILTAKNNYMGNSKTVLNLNSHFEKHASYVKFFEQVFDWEAMAYTFYPYFYASNVQWEDLFQQSNGTDPVFQAFLQSGMARMEVPVRPGFENQANYFMETGKIWMGNQLAVERDDDLYLSVAEELQQPAEGVVENEWETRVPTDLTILQANAAPLKETGLPCCHNENEEENLAYGHSMMHGKDEDVEL